MHALLTDEEARKYRYYHADRIGVAVFQDMPQKYLSQGRTNMTVVHYVDDLKAMVAGRGSHPCILQWTAFNEVSELPPSWAQI